MIGYSKDGRTHFWMLKRKELGKRFGRMKTLAETVIWGEIFGNLLILVYERMKELEICVSNYHLKILSAM